MLLCLQLGSMRQTRRSGKWRLYMYTHSLPVRQSHDSLGDKHSQADLYLWCSFRDFGPLNFMYKNFASSWVNLTRPWTLLTSCFSHMDTGHIFVNLFSFYFLAPAAMSILTTSQFLGLYLAAGLVGNAVQLTAHLFQNRGVPSFSLGASGAINGVLTFFACAFPYQKLVLMLVVPLPAWVAVAGIISYDMYTALRHPVRRTPIQLRLADNRPCRTEGSVRLHTWEGASSALPLLFEADLLRLLALPQGRSSSSG